MQDFEEEKHDTTPAASQQLAATADPPLKTMWDSESAQNDLVAELNRL